MTQPSSDPTSLPLFARRPDRPAARRLAGAGPRPPVEPATALRPPRVGPETGGADQDTTDLGVVVDDLPGHPFKITRDRHGQFHLIGDVPYDASVVRRIRQHVWEQVEHTTDITDRERLAEEIAVAVDDYQQQQLRAGKTPMTRWDREHLIHAVAAAVWGLGPVQAMLEIPGVTDLVVRGSHNVLLHLADGRILRCHPLADSDEDLISDIQQWAAATNRSFTPATPHLDLALPGRARLSASAWFTAYPTVTIRKHSLVDIDTADLVELGAIDHGIREFLTACIRAGKSIIVSGAPKAGKTTAIRAILNELPPEVPIATIETDFELYLHEMPHRHHEVWPAQEQPGGETTATGERSGEVRVQHALAYSLRDSVSIIVVGEVRADEVIAMLQAMQVGTVSVSTIHAKSAKGTIDRIVSCATMHGGASEAWAYSQIATFVDVIVHLDLIDERFLGGTMLRHVDEIYCPSFNPDADNKVGGVMVWERGPDRRAVPTGNTPDWLHDITLYGFDPTILRQRRSTWATPLPTVQPRPRGTT